MKISVLFLIIGLTSLTCSNKIKNEIKTFEKSFGKTNSSKLNAAVDNFEKKLLMLYPDQDINDAYFYFLQEIKENKLQVELDSTIQEKLQKADFIKEFYLMDKNIKQGINYNGKFFIGLKSIEHKDTLIKNYLRILKSAGILSTNNFVDGILSGNPDFNNYFHKRIVISYFYL